VLARAWYLGSRIQLRHFERGGDLGLHPLTMSVGSRGLAIVFRFGVLCAVDLDRDEEKELLARASAAVIGPFDEPETEECEIVIDESGGERIDAEGAVHLRDASVERMQVVAEVLAKSTVLAHHEERVANVFDRIERLATELRRGATSARGRDLVREIGGVLQIQSQTVGRVEVTEKPEITWDHPELDRLYERLALEYELRDRDLALTRKLDLAARGAQTYLDLLISRRSLRLEWYIVILIAIEIVLIVWEILSG
jgi:uncharacterized Rmd1/YagE family protein